ncbi:hypothetical protein ACKWTF_014806 [Chironomus riparius]
MLQLMFIFIFILKTLQMSVEEPDEMTIREFYNKMINDDEASDYFIRTEDEDCLKEKLKLKKPENEIQQKLKLGDLELILKGAGISCQPNIEQIILKNFIENSEKKWKVNENIDFDCLKNEIYRLQPTLKLIEGFDPAIVANKQDFCKKNLKMVEEDFEWQMAIQNGVQGLNEYRQCLEVDYNTYKVIHCTMLVIISKTVGDENIQAGRKDIVNFQKNIGLSQFECIMNKLGK